MPSPEATRALKEILVFINRLMGQFVPAETRKYVAKIVAALIMSMDAKLAEGQGYSPIDPN